MNVVLLTYELNVCGGTHKQLLRLAEYLLKQGHDVTILTRFYDLEKTYPEFKEIKVKSLYKDDWNKTAPQTGFINKIKNKIHKMNDSIKLYREIPKDVDIINIHDNGLDEVLLLQRLFFKKAKTIWQINDLPYCFRVGTNAQLNDGFKQYLKRVYMRFISTVVDEITVNVTKNAERVEQCFSRKAKVFYCGVDVNDALEKHTYNIKDNSVRILSSGVLFPYRNYETLVYVVENLKSKNINVHLDVIGATDRSPAYSEKIINLVKEKQLENEITIWGQVDDAKYNELHNGADMFAFININQSWGLAVFEAMSCGLPVIVSESVGAIELLHNNEDAIIVDPENVEAVSDVVLKLMNDKDYYNKISENAYKAVKEFTWDNLYSSKAENLFKELQN